jgi:tetratricopeptide (TPR) repeat protein
MVDLKDEKAQLKALENLFAQKRFSEALAMAEKLNSDFPDSYYINILYIKVLMELNRLSEAEDTAKGLLQLYPDNINLLQQAGNICLKLNKYDESIEYNNKILFLDPFNTLAKESIEKIKALRKTVEGRGKKSPDFVSYQDEKMIARQDTVPEDQLPDSKTNVDQVPEIPVGSTAVSVNEDSEPPPIPEVEVKEVPDMNEEILEEEVKEEVEIMTESAAELYLSQGLYKDALKIYEKLYAIRQEERFILKIRQLKTHIINQKKIQRLTDFWKLIQKRGEKIV